MKKRILFTLSILYLTSIAVFAQKTTDTLVLSNYFINEGIELYDNEKYTEAHEKFDKILPGDSLYNTAVYEKALTYQGEKKYRECINMALTGLAFNDPNKMDFYFLLASAYDYLDKQDSSFYYYNKGELEFPYTHRFHYERGIAYTRKKMHKEAIEAYRKSITFNFYHANSHLKLGIAAAEADRPTLAIMALGMYCMLRNDASNLLSVITTAEKIAENEYAPEEKINTDLFAFANDLEITDQVVKSKLALSDKYKLKSKLNYKLIRQFQAICEKLPENYEGDFVLKNYINFYRNAFSKGYFNGMSVYMFQNIQIEDVQKVVKKNKADIDKFTSWGAGLLLDVRRPKTIMFDGKEQQVNFYFDGSNRIASIGNYNSSDKRDGLWQFYHNSGYKSAEGYFKNDNKSGLWKYYHRNGVLRKTESYNNDGKVNGEYVSYFESGCLYEKATYLNDEPEGEVLIYYPNQHIETKMNFKAGKQNGKKITYNENGLPNQEYTLVDGMTEGEFITYHPGGEVDFKGNTVKNNITGKATYLHANGKLRSEGEFINGDRTGTWKWYNDEGTLTEEGSYTKGKKSGEWKNYYDNGKISGIELYSNGEQNGVTKEYDLNGQILVEKTFKADKLVSYKFFDAAGKVMASAKQEGGKLNYVNYNWLRNKEREGTLKNGMAEGTWKYYYKNGALQGERSFKDGEIDGISKTYHKSGMVESESVYKNGKRHGIYKSYYKNGKQYAVGYYYNGIRNGQWIYYHPNGNIDTKEFYNDNMANGPDYEYTSTGELSSVYYYDHDLLVKAIDYYNGLPQDTSIFKCGEGVLYNTYPGKPKKIMFSCNYKHGKADGTSKHYYKSGQLRREQNYKNGMRNGGGTRYHQNGKKSSDELFKNNDATGEWAFYNYDGKPSKIANYKNDELNGAYKTFYDNGKVEVERTYKDDERHGDLKMYGPDGTLIIQYKYEYGVLLSYTYLDKAGQLLPAIPVKNETVKIQTFYPNGNKALEYELKNGELQGKYIIYYETGKVYSEITYMNNETEGKYVEYYANGSMKKEANYFYDQLQGEYKLFHENGKVRLKATYVDDDAVGTSTEYDVTGKTIKTYEY